jgi:hypothetical protein
MPSTTVAGGRVGSSTRSGPSARGRPRWDAPKRKNVTASTATRRPKSAEPNGVR